MAINLSTYERLERLAALAASALQEAADVLIVSRTQMGGGNVCIGGFDISKKRNIRLLTSNGGNQTEDALFQICQIWKIAYTPKFNLACPHSEDVMVQTSHLSTTLNREDAKRFISQNCNVISGSLSNLFGGSIHSPLRAASYIDATSVPDHSVCFWRPNSSLTYKILFNKDKYHYIDPEHNTYFAYVGTDPVIEIIPKGSIVRMSLARWWAPPNSESKACYLQLSGWF